MSMFCRAMVFLMLGHKGQGFIHCSTARPWFGLGADRVYD